MLNFVMHVKTISQWSFDLYIFKIYSLENVMFQNVISDCQYILTNP